MDKETFDSLKVGDAVYLLHDITSPDKGIIAMSADEVYVVDVSERDTNGIMVEDTLTDVSFYVSADEITKR